MKVRTIYIKPRNGKYTVLVEYLDGSGKRRSKSVGTYATKKEADTILMKTKLEYEELQLSADNPTVLEWSLRYIEEFMKGYTQNTRNAYRSMINAELHSSLGSMKLNELNVMTLQNWYNQLLNKYNTNTANLKWQKLKVILKTAYQMDLVKVNLVDKVITFRDEPRKGRTIYTEEQVHRILHLLKEQSSHLLVPVALASMCGLRVSEIQALTWDKINFNAKTITIDSQSIIIEGKVCRIPPKYHSSGILPISDTLGDILKSAYTSRTSEYVATNSLGRQYRWQNLGHSFSRFCSRNDIPDLGMHSLRHYCLTALANKGCPINLVKAYARHKTLAVTSHYLHANLKDIEPYLW